ncbi:hypothetical protein DMUE_4285, partial [Dictyocoela muelleri]
MIFFFNILHKLRLSLLIDFKKSKMYKITIKTLNMFFLQIILYLILIKSDHSIKIEDFEEIKRNCYYSKQLGTILYKSVVMLAYAINEYNINIENEYPELNSISKLYKDTI